MSLIYSNIENYEADTLAVDALAIAGHIINVREPHKGKGKGSIAVSLTANKNCPYRLFP